MKRILCICDKGVNRSVNVASLLKFTGEHDTIPIGLDNTSQETLKMLYGWADVIILTEPIQRYKMPEGYDDKIQIWNVGPDMYPRPYNHELNTKVRNLIKQNPL